MTREAAYIGDATAAAYPTRSGNAVRPWVDGEPAFRRICEAVEAAHSSVWVTVAYLERDVQLPDGRGSFFDVLERAAKRGVEVRVLFWREPRLPELEPDSSHFPGTEDERRWLGERDASFLARWDRQHDGFCQHQKSWLIDAGEAGEIAFVGGINLDAASVSPPGHAEPGREHHHDAYVELRGPSASDVHHNFVQRWNGASERALANGVWPSPEAANDLEFPALLSRPAGDVPVQVTRTIPARHYADEAATPGGKPFAIADGETSVREQYLAAIGAARRSLYFENQAIGSPAIVDALTEAVDRGVEVVFVVPGRAHPAFVAARRDPRSAYFFERLGELGARENFTLIALASSLGDGHYGEIYVHAKLAIADDTWATIGSTNIADRSFGRDSELNVSFWHAATARALRCELLDEHLGIDTRELDDVSALRRFREIARENCDNRTCWRPLQGLAYLIDPRDYGA